MQRKGSSSTTRSQRCWRGSSQLVYSFSTLGAPMWGKRLFLLEHRAGAEGRHRQITAGLQNVSVSPQSQASSSSSSSSYRSPSPPPPQPSPRATFLAHPSSSQWQSGNDLLPPPPPPPILRSGGVQTQPHAAPPPPIDTPRRMTRSTAAAAGRGPIGDSQKNPYSKGSRREGGGVI